MEMPGGLGDPEAGASGSGLFSNSAAGRDTLVALRRDTEAAFQKTTQEINGRIDRKVSLISNRISALELKIDAKFAELTALLKSRPAGTPSPTPDTPTAPVWSPRRLNGRLDYLNDPPVGGSLGADTPESLRWTKDQWAQLICPSGIDNAEAVRPVKNCQRPFKPPGGDDDILAEAQDPDILKKLGTLQTALRDEHTPYSSWPTRILFYLSFDFRCIYRFIQNFDPTWPQVVEAIVTVLLDNNTLDLPLSTLAAVSLLPQETYGDFASRLRTAVDNLSLTLRNTDAVQTLTADIIRRNAPPVWRELERAFVANTKPPVLVEHAKRLADEQDRIITANHQQLSSIKGSVKLTAPRVEHPLSSEVEVNLVTSFESRTGRCFNCGSEGHWRRDCQENPRIDNQRPPYSQRNVHSGSSYDSSRRNETHREQRPRFPQRAGSHASSGRGSDRSGRGAHSQERRPDSQDRRPNRPRKPYPKRQVSFATGTNDEEPSGIDDSGSSSSTSHDNEADRDDPDESRHSFDVNEMVYQATREGYGTTHNLFAAQINDQPGSVFFDYGSTTCWIEEPFVPCSSALDSTHPTTLRGIGGFGANISHDAEARITFTHSSQPISLAFTCGVVPTGTFPGAVTLGKTVFHQLGLEFLSHDRVRLNKIADSPILEPTASTVYAVEEITTALIENMKAKLQSIFPTVFHPQSGRITGTVSSQIEHTIEIDPAKQPVRLPPRRYSQPQLKALRTFCETGLAQNVIERVENKNASPWSAQAHLVPKATDDRQKFKKNRDDLSIIYRVCVDYRALNRATRKHAFPLPNIEDQIHKASGHKYYCVFDLLHGFWHIPIEKSSRSCTAFSTPFGQFQWLVMPFGLTNSPATFQSLMNEVLEPLQDFVAGMMDDICLWGDTIEECKHRVHLLFERLAAYGLVINDKKSRWLLFEVKFLGFLINNNGYRIDPDRTAAILERPPPVTVTELRSFLSAVSFVRQFIHEFTNKAAPLYELLCLQKGSTISLSKIQLHAWKKLRQAMTEAPLLRTFDYRLPCVIDPDSSQICAGAVLFQPSISSAVTTAGTLQPVAYMSHKLSPTQQNYSTQERELLAIMLALRKWRHWVEGADITVRTDHQSLSTIRTKIDIPPRISRFIAEIEHYSPRIIYRKGKFQNLPDWLSRPAHPPASHRAFPATDEEGNGDELDDAPVGNPQELNFIDLVAITEFLRDRQQLPAKLTAAFVHKHFLLREGKLFCVIERNEDPPTSPIELREVRSYADLVTECTLIHTERGHATAGVLLKYALERFWHPDLVLVIQETIRECQRCQLMLPPLRLAEPLTPIPPAEPLERWGVDFTTIEARPVRTAIDYATSWAEATFVENMTAIMFIRLMNRLATTYNFPKEIIADNGAAFVDTTARTRARELAIEIKNTTPAHPQTNGKIERFHGQLKQLYYRMRPSYRDAETCLTAAVLTFNRSPQISGFSPFFLLYGVQPRWPRDHTQPAPVAAPSVNAVYTREFTEDEEKAAAAELVTSRTELGNRSTSAAQRAATAELRSYLNERKAQFRTFEKGDWVLRARQRKTKLEPYYDGPFSVDRVSRHNNTYTLRTPGGIALRFRYNGNNLFPAYVRDGQPVRSLWYASRTLLEQDRRRIAAAALDGAVPI